MGFFESRSARQSFEGKPLIAGTPYVITYKRWLILATVSTTLFLDTFSVAFFGFINDVTTIYFELTPAQTDLLSALNMLPRFLVGFILALIAKKLNLKSISTIMTAISMIASFFVVTGVSSRNNSFMVIIGQLLGGVSASMALALSQMAPSNWFPENERGKAVALPWILRRLSPVVSNIIATRTIKVAQQNVRCANNTAEEVFSESLLITSFRDSFQIAFSALALIAFTCFVLAIFYVTDYPPKKDGTHVTPRVQKPLHFYSELRETLSLFANRRYIILLIMHVVILSSKPMIEWMLTSVVLKGFPELNDRIVGIMFCVGYSVGCFGSPVGGVLLDHYRRPKLTYALGMTAVTLGYGVFSLSIYIHSYNLLFVSYVCIDFLRDVCLVCITHATVELMQNSDSTAKVRAFSIAGSLPSASLIGYTALIRLAINKDTPFVAALTPIPFHFVAFFLYLFIY